MAVRIGQAIYGERDRAHRLLAASGSFPDADSLAGAMDLQGSPPPHTEWRPYLSGFLWRDHYVLARTAHDPSGTRGNMVFSRAFAIPADAAGDMDDIRGLLSLLEEHGERRDAAVDVEWRPGEGPPEQGMDLAAALAADGPSPVVWAGDQGFPAAVAGLWSALWPAARLALRFRIAFSPTDASSDPPTVVTTPAALATRWSGYRIARPGSAAGPFNRTARYLSGGARDGELPSLVDAFGAQIPDIRGLATLCDLEQLLQDGASFEGYLGAIRLAAHLAPDPKLAGAEKRRLLDGVVLTTPTAAIADIRMARNLDLGTVKDGRRFWSAVADWAAGDLWKDPDADSVLRLVEESLSDKPVPEWRQAIAEGMRKALSAPSRVVATRLWSLLARRAELLARFAQLSTSRGGLERALVDTTPATLPKDSGATLAAQSLSLKMVMLHAACCAANLTPEEAIERHLTDAPFDAASLALAAGKAKGPELVAAALAHSEPQLLAMAVEAAAGRPNLLRRLEVADSRWRAIWLGALRLNPRANSGLAKPDAAVAALLDGILDGRIADAALVDALSSTNEANLLGYARRDEVWPSLADPARSRFRAATATEWLLAAERGEENACEEALAEEIAKPERLDPTLDRLVASPALAFPIFRALPQVREARFTQWLRQVLTRGPRFAVTDAAALGRLVAARSWEDAAKAIADAITDAGRSDLRPAVEYIVDMVGMTRRWYLDELGNSTPLSAKWQILLELLLELYGHGPSDTEIWRRAGGKDKDVPKGSSGADIWRKIVDAALKGKGDIEVSRLIVVMHEDYPHHPSVRKFSRDTQFGGGWS